MTKTQEVIVSFELEDDEEPLTIEHMIIRGGYIAPVCRILTGILDENDGRVEMLAADEGAAVLQAYLSVPAEHRSATLAFIKGFCDTVAAGEAAAVDK